MPINLQLIHILILVLHGNLLKMLFLNIYIEAMKIMTLM